MHRRPPATVARSPDGATARSEPPKEASPSPSPSPSPSSVSAVVSVSVVVVVMRNSACAPGSHVSHGESHIQYRYLPASPEGFTASAESSRQSSTSTVNPDDRSTSVVIVKITGSAKPAAGPAPTEPAI